MKLFEKITNKKEIEIRFLNAPIVQYGISENCDFSETYIDIFPKKGKREKIFEQMVQLCDEGFDDIYFTRYHLGENRILAMFLEKWIQENGSKKPVIIVTSELNPNFFKLYGIDIPVKILPVKWFDINGYFRINQTMFNYKKHRIYMYINQFYTDNYWRSLRTEEEHFFYDEITKYMNFKEPKKLIISNATEIENNVLKKAQDLKLNLNNFVILSPIASTIKNKNEKFYDKLTKQLTLAGIDIFSNDAYKKFKTHKFTFEELAYLASKSRAIIGHRSGLLDVLLETNCPMHVLYNSPTKFVSAKKAMEAFSLAKLTKNNNIFEYSLENEPEKEIISKIFERME